MGNRILAASLLALALLAGACARLRPGGSGPIEHPAGADQLVLRVDIAGGLVPPEFIVTHIPSFSLYGDGRIATEGPQIEIYPGPALPNILVTLVTEEGVQRILEAARDAGLLGEDRHYDYPGIADAPTTTFTVVAEGGTHVISAYALGLDIPGDERVSGEDGEARAALAEFQGKLFDLRSWLPEGSIGEESAFEFDELRIFVTVAEPGGEEAPFEAFKDWPLPGLLATFGEPADLPPDTRCGTVGGPDLAVLLPRVQTANQLTLWRSSGETYRLMFRPLLPDESGC